MKILECLVDFGLSNQEAKVYLAIYRGAFTPTEISASTGLTRSFVYDCIATLKGKSLISEVEENGKKKYSAISPQQFASLIELKKEKLLAALNDTKQESKVKIMTFKGPHVLRLQLQDILSKVKKGDIIRSYGVDEESIAKMPVNFLKEYFTILKKRKCTELSIALLGTQALPKNYPIKYKFLPKEKFSNFVYLVYRGTVALLWPFTLELVLIEDEKAAPTYKEQFDLIWNSI